MKQMKNEDPGVGATKPTHLRSEMPAGVIEEIYVLSLGHFVIRSLMFEAAGMVGLKRDRLLFLGCFQSLKCQLPEGSSSTPQSFEAWYQALFWKTQHDDEGMTRCGGTGSIPG